MKEDQTTHSPAGLGRHGMNEPSRQPLDLLPAAAADKEIDPRLSFVFVSCPLFLGFQQQQKPARVA